MIFSIIIPAHNAENRIRKALESIKSQTFTDYEIIVICDACDDDTEVVAREYTDKTHNINAHNDGVARSEGLDYAQGEYVMFMDDDDWWLHPYVLESIYKRIWIYNEYEAYRNNFRPIDIMCCGFVFGEEYGLQSPWNITKEGRGLWANVWSKVWRREFIGGTRFPNVHSVSDFEFCKLCEKKNPVYRFYDAPIYYYNYMRPGSITETDAREGKE